MATIIENNIKRRTIKLSTDDVISIIQQYQLVTRGHKEAPIVRDLIKNSNFYVPEDV
ncbi:MAG: hypothetical protein NC390_00360 [Fusobacterium sp.]|nr:hypothetical protein [Fusobacterium sp.]